jgi:hypothetical protein
LQDGSTARASEWRREVCDGAGDLVKGADVPMEVIVDELVQAGGQQKAVQPGAVLELRPEQAAELVEVAQQVDYLQPWASQNAGLGPGGL